MMKVERTLFSDRLSLVLQTWSTARKDYLKVRKIRKYY